MKFLVIDDSSAMRKMVIRTLKHAGYNGHDFMEAEDGQKGLEMIESWGPDMVLSDWHMPVMTGIEMAEELHSRKSDVKLGLITTERAKENVERANNAGVLFVVQKPFTVQSLQEALLPIFSDQPLPERVEQEEESIAPTFLLPTMPQVQDLLNRLLSVKVTLSEGGAQSFESLPLVAGLYAGPDNATRAIWVTDIRGACALGASLTIIPSSEVFTSLRSREIPSGIFDNLREIYNILGSLFHREDIQQDVHLSAAHIIKKPNEKLKALMVSPGVQRLDIEIQSDDYGKGLLSALVVT
jgi:CheY-like chemotaxis protein